VATVLYSLNWVIALTGLAPNSLGITWSLAVEEQFYLLWPLTFLVRRWPRFPIYVAVAGVLTAPLLRFLLWDGSAGAARRIYYGTDTRMDGLLLGCLLAYLVRSRLPMPRWSVPAAWAVVAGCALAPMREAFSVLALPTLVPIATCVLIVSCLPATSGWLTSRPMRWLGQRSYGLYLWHYPLLMIAAPELGIPGWSLLPVAFVVAEASYRYVEQPVLRRTGRQTTKSTSAAVAPPLSRA
jgi:peptidoglycan/LPS O-acetylase OafA/YrhL